MSVFIDIGDRERQKISAQKRLQDIICTCELLRREGLGNLSPNEIVKMLTKALKRRRG